MSARTRAVLAALDLTLDEDRRRRYYQSGWWREGTAVEDFERRTDLHPDKTAVVAYRHEQPEPDRISYGALATYVDRAAAALRHFGVESGDVVSAQLPNWWQFPVVALAAHKVGAIFNPVLTIHRRREVAFITDLLRPKIYILARTHRGFDYEHMVSELCASSDHAIQRVVVDGHPATDDACSFEADFIGREWEGVGDQRTRTTHTEADSVSDVQFTSGTTGEPKGVGHTHNTLYARTRALFEPLELGGDDVVFMPSPLAHSTGFVYGCMTPLMLGMTAVYQDVWDPEKALDIAEAERPTWTFGSTTFLVDLLEAGRARRGDLSSLRYFVAGGAAIPPAIVSEARKELGTRVMAVWGMTENGAVTVTRPDEPELAAADSDGRPCPWMEMKVVDPATGAAVAPGHEGALFVRGASQMLGYVKRPALTEALSHEGGWFDTGDLARRVGADHVRITGRSKDVIIRGGENIPVAEVEGLLYEHPLVAEVALVGYPDARLGERAAAVVVPRPGGVLTLKDLTLHLDRQGVSKTYWPERLELRSALPRTGSGKVQKFKLRESLAARPSAP